ncbi:hypothetical protein HH214_20510 [Mucilaginibacter robiniae]|uniref:Lipocalin-like domain-containing protein n=1 Tax=Mucilaginibacter robiniae TaxID=2728022 RepID=A0A7L5E6S5_9SPHI|nr:hypothetical protein [Mucilaginibacter robiniae]QJD98087.1 hypothetical protein HH214_20510 [Mucilaginibacter robiniae]
MKNIYVIVLLLSSVTAACKKSKIHSSSSVIGKWKLVSYSGGVAGFKHHPATEDVVLSISIDSQLTVFNSNVSQSTVRYVTNEHYAFSSSYNAPGIQLGSERWQLYSISHGLRDTLSIGWYNSPDFLYPEYERIK